MLKEHMRVKTAMNAGRVIGRMSRTPGSGKAALWIVLVWVVMILFVIVANKFNLM